MCLTCNLSKNRANICTLIFSYYLIKENQIIITDFLDHPFFSISIDKLKEGVLSIDDYGHDLLHKYDDEIKQIEW